MLVPGPERHDEGVAFLPMKRLAVDHRCAAAAEGVVDARAGVAVRFGFFAGAQQLNPAGQRRKRRAAGCGVDEFQRDAVVGVAAATS